MGITGEEHLPTLLDWAGGPEAIGRMLNAFYDRVEQDDLLAPVFHGRVSQQHRDHVTVWWVEVLGGPSRYTDELGGFDHMVRKHLNLAITREQQHRFTSLMSLAADDAALPHDPEFRAALMGYVEWGSRMALINSQPGHPLPKAPVPHWGWGVAPPYNPGA